MEQHQCCQLEESVGGVAMSAGHNSSAYFKPHPKGALGFFVECVTIWCADQKPILDNPVNMAAAKAKIHTTVAGKLGSASADMVEHFANIEFAAFQSQLVAHELSNHIRQMATPRPKKGNRRRDVPEHLPLRPEKTIIAVKVDMLRADYPYLSVNALFDKTAEFFNDGIARTDPAGKLTGRNIRSAYEAHVGRGRVSLPVELQRSAERARLHGLPHLWDRTVYDHIYAANRLETGIDAGTIYRLSIGLPLIAIDEIYKRARAGRRFAGLAGAEAAQAIDRSIGIATLMSQYMDELAEDPR